MKCKHNEGSNFDRAGQWVIAKYQEQSWVTGVVKASRVKLGGRIQHSIVSDSPTYVGEELRVSGTAFLIEENNLSEAEGVLHV
tara:strand:- start:43 stop:291 length:249 start_codon:yes stop_codon:yes gene_type:complete